MAKMAKDYNDADVKFLQMMIPHHQKAVDASATAYHAGLNPEVKKWETAIWNGQKAEIEKFKKWLTDRGLKVGGGM